MEKMDVEAAVTSTHNLHYLMHYVKFTEYLQDRVRRLRRAWVTSNRKRVPEIEVVQEVMAPRLRKKPRKETFRLAPTKLNFHACMSVVYPLVPRTEMLDCALENVARIYRTDEELRTMDNSFEASIDGPSTPPITSGEE